MQKMEPGTYEGTTTAASIYEAPSGAVMCNMLVDFGNGINLRGGVCLVQKDGTMSERGFKDVSAILGFQGGWDWDIWGNDPEFFAGHLVSAVIETINNEKGEFSSIKFLNPPAGSLQKADAKGLAAKYGAKTRAMLGGIPAPAAKPAALKAPAAPKPPPAPAPTAAPVRKSTMEDSWECFTKANEGKSELELYPLWNELIQKATGKGQNDCDPADWGKVMAELDNLPF